MAGGWAGCVPDLDGFVSREKWCGVEGHAWKKGAWANGMDQWRKSISSDRHPHKPGAGPKPTRRIAQPVLKPGHHFSRPARVGPAGIGRRVMRVGGCLAANELPWCGRDNPRAGVPCKGSPARGLSFPARSTAGATRSVLRARAKRGGLWIVGGVR